MAHHGNESFMDQNQFAKEFKDFFKTPSGNPVKDAIGATGSFPDGKLNENDEGEIAIAITKSNGNVVIDFGMQVHWIGFTTAQAIGIGELLIKRAKEIIKERDDY